MMAAKRSLNLPHLSLKLRIMTVIKQVPAGQAASQERLGMLERHPAAASLQQLLSASQRQRVSRGQTAHLSALMGRRPNALTLGAANRPTARIVAAEAQMIRSKRVPQRHQVLRARPARSPAAAAGQQARLSSRTLSLRASG